MGFWRILLSVPSLWDNDLFTQAISQVVFTASNLEDEVMSPFGTNSRLVYYLLRKNGFSKLSVAQL